MRRFRADLRWRLRRQRQSELVQENPDIVLRFDVARKRDDSSVRRRHDHVHHLHRPELLDDLARGEAWCVVACDRPQCLEQAERHDKTRKNYKALFDIAMYSKDYQFKFVYSGPECENEILDMYREMSKFVEPGDDCELEVGMRRHPMKNTQLMPEGLTNEQLSRTRLEAAELCIKNGWRFVDREHIIIWGDKRGV